MGGVEGRRGGTWRGAVRKPNLGSGGETVHCGLCGSGGRGRRMMKNKGVKRVCVGL